MSFLKTALVRTGAVSALLAAGGRRLRILMYHGISPYGLAPETFEQQLRYVRDRFDCVWASEIPEILDGGRRTRKPPLVLTFDDGLRNNLTRAAPLLERYGIKATFFIVSDLLDGESMLWNHELLCRLLLAEPEHLPAEMQPVEPGLASRLPAVRRFVERVKAWNKSQREDLLDTLRRRDPAPSYQPWMWEMYGLMSSEELLRLPELVEIGSHTRTHPILPSLSTEEAQEEIQGSRQILEELSGRPVSTFCYPDGQLSERDESLAAQIYSVAVSVEEGIVGRQAKRHRLPRIPAAGNLVDFGLRMIRPGSGGPVAVRIPDLATDERGAVG